MTKNWFGLDLHPTDEYVHWTEADPVTTAKKLRSHWDFLVKGGERSETALKFLLDAAYYDGLFDGRDV